MSEQEPSFRSPLILIPFLAVTLIWGSTWIVIKDQLSVVPPGWSVSYRFFIAGLTMLAVAAFRGEPLSLGIAGQRFAFLFGIAQFTFNFNFVYRAELYVTSGLVAVVFALLFLPNAILTRIFIGGRFTRNFLIGSAIAVLGIALLFINEARGDAASQTSTLIGMGLTLLAVMCASTANVMQASKTARALPMTALIGWAMIWGASINSMISFTTVGPPVFEWRLGYVLGLAYLGIFASALAFSLYFQTIRDIGPAKAAYSSVAIPILAMGFSTALEGYSWTWLAAAGSVVALAGMVVALMAPKPST